MGWIINIYFNIISLIEFVTDYNIELILLNKIFDILCSYVIYNYNVFCVIMLDDIVYLGFVRDFF